jgi:transcriptional regulator with XRE-family HTH domain
MGQRWNRLIDLRTQADLTQEELAKRLEITRSALSNYESGHREPDFATIHRIADYFKVSIDYLLGRTNEQGQVITATEISPEWYRILKLAKERGYTVEDIEATLQVIDRMVSKQRQRNVPD